MDFCNFVLGHLPVSVAMVRESDQVIIAANAQFRNTFLLGDEDVGTLKAPELIAAEHLEKFIQDYRNGLDRSLGSQQEQFRIFRRKDGKTFIGWSRNVRSSLDGQGLVTISAVFEYYDQAEEAFNLSGYQAAQNAAVRSQMAQFLVENLNSTLGGIKLVISDEQIPVETRKLLDRALIRAEEFSSRVLRLGMMTDEVADSALQTIPLTAGHEGHADSRDGSLGGYSVLVVDDDPLLTELLCEGLTSDGCRVSTAHSKDEASNLISSNQFDLAVIDLRLEREDGREVAKLFSSTAVRTGIVFISAFSHAAAVLELAGEHQVLRKPFSFNELRSALLEVLHS